MVEQEARRLEAVQGCCLIVCSITFGPAKPVWLPGSETSRSPSIAKDALTPPYVGSVKSEMKSRPSSFSRPTAWLVFASCMSETQPSCIRAPPDAEITSSGSRRSSASSAAPVIASPTPPPMLPPMKAKSIAATTIGLPPIVALP